jgi:hypothetical protein
MDEMAGRMVAVVIRVGVADQPAFQLRKGETGLSVFDPASVDPPLTDDEILAAFRPGSVLISRPISTIEETGLQIITTPGGDVLSDRLRAAHREIGPGAGMNRQSFKTALKNLE